MDKKYFSIILGEEPGFVQVGKLNPETGQPENAADAKITKGEMGLPNYSTAWGQLLKDPKTKELTGEIKFMPWGEEGGEIVELCYMPNISSLSIEFQRLRKVVKGDKNAEITIHVGVNNFDPIRQKMLVMMLKYHYQNKSNKSRNPDATWIFQEYNPEDVIEVDVTDIEVRQRAENIVLSARYDDKAMAILAELFEMDVRQQQDVLFRDLIARTKKPANFMQVIDERRRELEAVLMKSRDIDLIDCENPENILIRKNGSKEFLIEGIPVSKDSNIVTVMRDFHLPKYYLPLGALKGALAVFEKEQLQ